MSAATPVLLDTSVVIALARAEALQLPDPLPDATISSITLCGLHRGVIAARADQRAARLAVLTYAERTFTPLPLDARVAPHYARLADGAERAGRDVRRHLADLLIAATAAAHGLTLLTCDCAQHGTPGVTSILV